MCYLANLKPPTTKQFTLAFLVVWGPGGGGWPTWEVAGGPKRSVLPGFSEQRLWPESYLVPWQIPTPIFIVGQGRERDIHAHTHRQTYNDIYIQNMIFYVYMYVSIVYIYIKFLDQGCLYQLHLSFVFILLAITYIYILPSHNSYHDML